MFLQNYTDIYIQLIISIWYTYIRDSLAWNMCSRDTDPSISSCAIHSTRCQTWRFLGFQKVVKGGKKILGIRPPPTYPSFWNSSPLKHHKQTKKIELQTQNSEHELQQTFDSSSCSPSFCSNILFFGKSFPKSLTIQPSDSHRLPSQKFKWTPWSVRGSYSSVINNGQNLLFGCGSFRVFLLVFFPRDEAPFGQAFFKR